MNFWTEEKILEVAQKLLNLTKFGCEVCPCLDCKPTDKCDNLDFWIEFVEKRIKKFNEHH